MKTLVGENRKIFKKAKKLSRGLYKNICNELFINKKDRFTINIDNSQYSDLVKDTDEYKLIDNYLSENKYKIVDFIQGIAEKENDKNKYKIGRLIKHNKYLSDKFRDCVYRHNLKFVISRHPYDIACASYNQDWDSCLNIKDGFNNSIMNDMIVANSVMIAYLVSGTKNTVLGRCFIIPYYNFSSGDYWLYTANTGYGLFPDKYIEFLRDWLDKNYNNKYLLPNFISKDIVVKFTFPEELVYNNDDKSSIKIYNVKGMDKYTIRKYINEYKLEQMLRAVYISTQEYPDLNIVRDEVTKFYDYHKSYGKDLDSPIMKRCKFMLYWISGDKIPKNELIGYFKYLRTHKLRIKRNTQIEKLIVDELWTFNNVCDYISILDEKINWKLGKDSIIQWADKGHMKKGGVKYNRLIEKFV